MNSIMKTKKINSNPYKSIAKIFFPNIRESLFREFRDFLTSQNFLLAKVCTNLWIEISLENRKKTEYAPSWK